MTAELKTAEPKKAGGYDESQITVLEGLEAVRKRPGMYIGGTGSKGLHHLIWEVVDNCVDEAMAGHASKVTVTLTPEGSVRVSDNGRGIPVGVHPQTGLSTLTTVLTILHAGGKFGGDGYKVSGGLHGVGVSVVNALSERLVATVSRDGYAWTQEFKAGVPTTKAPKKGRATKQTGTTIEFWPLSTIFETTEFDRELIVRRLRQMAYLNKGLIIELADLRHPEDPHEERFSYSGGVLDFVSDMAAGQETLCKKPIYAHGTVEVDGREITVEAAITWVSAYTDDVRSFVNTIATGDGGTHEEGFSRAVTRVINALARDAKILKDKDANFKGEDIREGMVAVISVLLPEPQFEGQTKNKLGSSIARTAVEQVVAEGLTTWAQKRPAELRAVVRKVEGARKAREAARAAREVSRKASALEGSSLPGKLADCRTKDVSRSEIFIVEGDSAMGSGKQARDAEFQALLPIRGKILNTYSVSMKRMLDNAECAAIITAVGAGVGSDFDLDQMRYGRVILLTDADVDGSHIRILLLTLFWRYMRPMLEAGRVFAAQPPLYKLKVSPAKRGEADEVIYLHSEAEYEETLAELEKAGRTVKTTNRYKGLGEMPASELAETVMDPKNRVLRRVTVEDAADAADLFGILMGSNSAARKEFITAKAPEVDELDV